MSENAFEYIEYDIGGTFAPGRIGLRAMEEKTFSASDTLTN